jgi:molybdopterin-guanine dinucleotide biosynthesis protein A
MEVRSTHVSSAAILAGGRASRFGGRDKSTLVVGGATILERQLAELSQLTDDVMLVGSATDVPRSVRLIADRVSGAGPLGGLDAALASARDDAVAVVACDMPFVSAGFLASLLDFVRGFEAVVPFVEGRYHPLCAVYTRQCRQRVARRLANGQLTMMGLLDEVRVRVVAPGDLPGFDCRRLVANVNTPGELENLEALQGHEP